MTDGRAFVPALACELTQGFGDRAFRFSEACYWRPAHK